MWTDKLPNVGKRDGGGLVNDCQVTLSNLLSVIGEDKLNELPVLLEDVYSNHCIFILFVAAKHLLVVQPILVIKQLQPNTHELKQS